MEAVLGPTQAPPVTGRLVAPKQFRRQERHATHPGVRVRCQPTVNNVAT